MFKKWIKNIIQIIHYLFLNYYFSSLLLLKIYIFSIQKLFFPYLSLTMLMQIFKIIAPEYLIVNDKTKVILTYKEILSSYLFKFSSA